MAKLLLLLLFILLLLLFSFSFTKLISSTARSTPFVPFQPSIQTEQQLQNLPKALIGADDFGNWAGVLSLSDPSTLPITSTVFIPSNNSDLDPSFHEPSTVAYHMIPQQLSFSDLQQFQINSRLPTFLLGKTILVTNNSRLNYTIDGIPITSPDWYINGEIAIHRIASVLNYSKYGDDPFLPHHHNDAANCSCIEFPVLLSVFLTILGLMITGFYPIR